MKIEKIISDWRFCENMPDDLIGDAEFLIQRRENINEFIEIHTGQLLDIAILAKKALPLIPCDPIDNIGCIACNLKQAVENLEAH